MSISKKQQNLLKESRQGIKTLIRCWQALIEQFPNKVEAAEKKVRDAEAEVLRLRQEFQTAPEKIASAELRLRQTQRQEKNLVLAPKMDKARKLIAQLKKLGIDLVDIEKK